MFTARWSRGALKLLSGSGRIIVECILVLNYRIKHHKQYFYYAYSVFSVIELQ